MDSKCNFSTKDIVENCNFLEENRRRIHLSTGQELLYFCHTTNLFPFPGKEKKKKGGRKFNQKD